MCVSAQNLFEDLNDEFIRLNPEIPGNSVTIDPGKRYSFIRYDLNYIEMNSDDWSELAEKLAQSKTDADFTIVHIGDSHIQADGNTGTTRLQLQSEYGDAGRGLITPFKLAGTNQPLDYKITSPSAFTKTVLMKRPWAVTPGFTGVALCPGSHNFSFNIEMKSPCGYFTILASGDLQLNNVTSGGRNISFEAERQPGGLYVSLENESNELNLSLSGTNIEIYGFDMRNDSHGVIYHAIGNNGAAFASYNGLPNFAESIAALEPDLVIVSLGTNDAFGRLTPETFNSQLASLVNKLRAQVPDAKLLMVTPSECQKSVYGTVGARKGRRRKSTRTRSYKINEQVAQVRKLILEYGEKNNIPVYDFYAVAGGSGSSDKWLAHGLLSSDRIHRTWAGYHLDGNLIHDALIGALTKY